MCAGPLFPGTVSRKKSPKPTRYMRTRMLALPEAVDCFAAAAPFGAASSAAGAPPEAALAPAFRGAFAAVLRGVFLVVLALAIFGLLVHEAKICLEVSGIGGVTCRHPQRHRKTALLLLAQLRGGAGHSFADGKPHLGWGRLERTVTAFRIRRLDDERDAAAEGKRSSLGNGRVELGLPRLNDLDDHFHPQPAI